LGLGHIIPACPFPIDALPNPAARLAEEAAGAIGCDPGMVAGPMLAVAGGLIGRSASLQMVANRFVSACILQATIAMPGDGKSASLGYATAPVRDIDRELANKFAADKRKYQERCKSDKTSAADPPVPLRVVVEDATMEAVFQVLAANERGLLMCLDELSTLIHGLNQYKGGRGNDCANLLKMWSGTPVVIDRVYKDFGEPTRIWNPHLCITGNLPPSVLADMVNPRGADGFLDRWLFVYPDRQPRPRSSQRRPVSSEAIEGWSALVRKLWGRPPDASVGPLKPHVLHFSDQGKTEFDRLYDDHVDEVNATDFPDVLRGPWSKLEEYAGRLCLILVLLRYAADLDGSLSLPTEVGPDLVRDAWRLIDYFKNHHRRVRTLLEGKGVGVHEGARLILNWIRNHPCNDVVPESELTRTYPRFREDRALLEDGLHWLEQRNALRRIKLESNPSGPGRKRATAWEIHPDLRLTENTWNT
jgi:hypothetical protein